MSAVMKEQTNMNIHLEQVETACKRLAPAWPLDQSIAVNPWWEMRDQTMEQVSAKLQALGKVNCLMPGSFYQSLWQQQIHSEHLQAAIEEFGSDVTEAELFEHLDDSKSEIKQWFNFCDLLDALPEQEKKMDWRDEIVQQISQFCGLYFQYPERMQQSDVDEKAAIYKAWLEVVQQDRGIEVLMGESGLAQKFQALPESPETLFEVFYHELGQPENFSEYAYALLLDVHGWASWMAYIAWQDNFAEKPNNAVEQLLAIRMAWEWVLWQHTQDRHTSAFMILKSQFTQQFDAYEGLQGLHEQQQKNSWIWQRALELSYQQSLSEKLLQQDVPEQNQQPELQAAFCIDVRSEPMRRALEAQHPGIQTIGFAGFFGLPIEYSPLGSAYTRPQLPGLLKPAIRAVQSASTKQSEDQAKSINELDSSKESIDAAPSAFGLIEMLGLFKAFNLLKNTWAPGEPQHSINDIDTNGHWHLSQEGKTLGVAEQADLAAGILGAIGLTQNFAPRVLLMGHGSCTANNPQAAGLDCGACGGQTGEVNVKILAQLLNDKAVREELHNKGIAIPENTRFIAGLHNTTTDELICYDANDQGQWQDWVENKAEWQTWLKDATRLAQKNRAESVGINDSNSDNIEKSYQKLSSDWAQIRPEWGLANNAAFIVAPRNRTRNINLEGRSFLHDYKWQDDEGFGVLELIMTAPMVVTNWINLQYYASVTDNLKYGSGNKLLHNVVGDHIGVFEGNAGDLRIGLSFQSVHDGVEWRHQPMRLSVYIAAPTDAMSDIINRHQHVADLLNNGWLYLFQLDEEANTIKQYRKGEWLAVS